MTDGSSGGTALLEAAAASTERGTGRVLSHRHERMNNKSDR